jgi:glycosyltransferase involved in cell wall biosynthesis
MSVNLPGLRVAIVAGTLGCGGAERQLYYIVRALKSAGAEATVVCLTQGEQWEEPIRALGVPVYNVPRRSSRAGRLLGAVSAVRDFRPDVVQSMHFYTNVHAAVGGWVQHKPSVGAIRSNVDAEVLDVGALFGRMCLRWPTILAANSRSAMWTAARSGVADQRLVLLRNVVDCAALPERPDQPTTTVSKFVFVGRLSREKRVDVLLEACAICAGTGLSFECVIVGDGPVRPALEAQSHRLSLADGRVTFLGEQRDMMSVYHGSDICVLASDHEGTPNVLLEASACGLPVIATRVGGVPDAVDDGVTGVLVQPGDADALAEAMANLAVDTQLRRVMGQAGRAKMLREYDLAGLPQLLSRLYAAAGVRNEHGRTL